MQEYRGGRLTLYHVDLYRLEDPREVADLGLDEIADGGVLAIEWADKLDRRERLAAPRHIAVTIDHGEADTRTIAVSTELASSGRST